MREPAIGVPELHRDLVVRSLIYQRAIRAWWAPSRPEERDPKLQRRLGNVPRAFSHFALVNAVFMLAQGTAMVPRDLAPRLTPGGG